MKGLLQKYYRLLQMIVTGVMGLLNRSVTFRSYRDTWHHSALHLDGRGGRFLFMWIILIGAMIG